MRKLLRLLFPTGVFALTCAVILLAGVARETFLSLSMYIFSAAAAITTLFSLRTGRTRHLFTALTLIFLGTTGVFIIPETGEMTERSMRLYNLTTLFVPLQITLFTWWRERGIFNLWGGLRVAWVVLPPIVIFFPGVHRLFAALPTIGSYMRAEMWQPWIRLSFPATAAFLFSLFFILFLFIRDATPAKSGFLWALVLIFLGFALFQGHTFFTLMMAAALFTVLVSMIETGHFIAYRDELTGLPARRALNEKLQKLGRTYSLVMVDIDHFKKFNDRYGHDVGDEVLRMVTTRLTAAKGQVYRYGGEEFTIVYPGGDLVEVTADAERIREHVASGGFTVRKPLRKKGRKKSKKQRARKRQNVSVTVSMGVAARSKKRKTPETVIKAADTALYRAKKRGRNRVEKT